jgi:hypothetical protein
MFKDKAHNDLFGDYLHIVMPALKKTPYSLSQFRNAGAEFGLKPGQMDLVTKVIRDLQILPFRTEARSTTISTPKTYLDTDSFSSLGALIFWTFNELLVGQKPNTVVTSSRLFDQFSETVPSIRNELNNQSDIVAKYPEIATNLLIPSSPRTDSTYTLSNKSFDIAAFIQRHGRNESMYQLMPPIADERARIMAEYDGLGLKEVDWEQTQMRSDKRSLMLRIRSDEIGMGRAI